MPGYLVSDGYALYKNWNGKGRQTCLAPLKRAPKKLSEDPVPDIAFCGQWMLQELDRLIKMSFSADALHPKWNA